ncbi:uncharacterized protein BXIN_2403 [Babesia sp. Xinjiang]|uniref:uncharacterized protein n=1 Tax=Babesia sp. Xinjiang TaxID=462227 RepID=UPI000A24E6BD|nr:uncharacterized protein BXIN_2403 [Babesia sp. Xinjiang]ORM40714.1 hypothetical protein BXIN_2403 [Babesia sp. Xinjiang]
MLAISHESLHGTASIDTVDTYPTRVVSLCNVDLKCLLDEEETTCSPFSDPVGLKNSESMFSDDPNYLWYVKQQAEMLRGSSLGFRSHRRDSSNVGSDVSSTCVMVNIKHDTCVNLCDNPSDMWHGLKMSDGTPVVIRSRRTRTKRYSDKRRSAASKDMCAPKGSDRKAAELVRKLSKDRNLPGRIGPIDYGTGFLSLQRYVGRGDGASMIYRMKHANVRSAHSSRRKEIVVRQRQLQVQHKLAEARGVVFSKR